MKTMLITKSYIIVDFNRITSLFRCTIYLPFSLSKFSTPWSYCYHSCCFTINIKQNRKIYYALNEWKKVSLHIIMTIFLYQYAPSFSLIWTKRLRFTMNHPKHYFKVETHLTLEIVQIFQRFFQMFGANDLSTDFRIILNRYVHEANTTIFVHYWIFLRI